MTEFYSQNDVQEILQLAIARQATNSTELTRTQLLEIADDLGISSSDLHLAEQVWRNRQQEQQEQQEFHRIQRLRVQQHLMKYGITNGFLLVLNWISTGHLSWSIYIAILWGLGLSLDAWKRLRTEGEDHDRAFQKWQRQRQLKRSVDTFLDRLLKPQV